MILPKRHKPRIEFKIVLEHALQPTTAADKRRSKKLRRTVCLAKAFLDFMFRIKFNRIIIEWGFGVLGFWGDVYKRQLTRSRHSED